MLLDENTSKAQLRTLRIAPRPISYEDELKAMAAKPRKAQATKVQSTVDIDQAKRDLLQIGGVNESRVETKPKNIRDLVI